MSKNYSKIIDCYLESTTIQTYTSILNNSKKNYYIYHKNCSFNNNNNKNYLRKKIKREKKEFDELETYSNNSYFSNGNIKDKENNNNYNFYLNNEIEIEPENKKETTMDNLFSGLLNKNYMTYHFELEGHKKHKKF